MSGGRRYNQYSKLNKKKVLAVILVAIVLIMFVIVLKKLLSKEISVLSRKYEKAYFTVFNEGKWGVIDNEANQIIPPQYDEMIIIPNKFKPVFICTYDVNYNENKYSSKAINQENVNLFEKYERVEAFINFDEQNSMWYEQNYLKVVKDGKYGIINIEGKEIVKCEYENIKSLKGIKEKFIVTKDGQQGLIDSKGKIIVNIEYSDITALTTNYEDGYIVKNKEGKFGIVNNAAEIVLDCKYSEIQNVCGNNLYVAKENSKWKIVNNEGHEFLEGLFDEVKSINGDNILIGKSKKYGVLNKDGAEIIPIEYKDLEYSFNDNYIAKKDSLYGVINTNKETKIDFLYTKISYRKEIECLDAEKKDYTSDIINNKFEIKISGIISDTNEQKGYIRIRQSNEYKYYNLKFEEVSSSKFLIENTLFLDKKDGKYGYVDKNGIVKIDYIYDDAMEQNEFGYAAVKKDGLWGVIDCDAQIIQEPKYDLENNLIIDFIGPWHLAEDINSNYYIK